jgi:integrase
MIGDLPRMAQNVHVFPGANGNPLVDLKRAWDRVRKNANLPDLRMHDLRRTCGSWLAGSGQSLPLIGKVLNHSQPSTTAIYARLDISPVRTALDGHAARVLAIEPKKPENGDAPEKAGE